MNIIIINIIFIILFGIYIEYYANIGNIIFRVNDIGVKVFQPLQLISFMFEPLIKNLFWQYKYWDINWIMLSIIINLFFILFL